MITTDCNNFIFRDGGGCFLLKQGISLKESLGHYYYEKLDNTDMSNCKMVKYELVTTDTAKIECGNAECNELKLKSP